MRTKDIPETLYVFLDTSQFICFNNVTKTGVLTSAAYSSARRPTGRPNHTPFRDKYLRGEVDYLPFVYKPPDFGEITPFVVNVINDYRVEHDAELTRRSSFPLKPSRLSAIYAFGDHNSCVKVSEKYNWPLNTVRQFKLDEDELTRVARVNMEVVSLARTAYRISSLTQEEMEKIWQHYWTGGGNMVMQLPVRRQGTLSPEIFESGEIWEYLIEGSLVDERHWK